MTEKLTSKECCPILKTLLALGRTSKQQLTKKLNEENKISRATVSKRVDELCAEGMVKIERGPRGPVGTHNCTLELKGLVYLILECNLEKEELEKTLGKLLYSEALKRIRCFSNVLSLPIIAQIMTESLSELRSMINLKYFDEEWFEFLLTQLFEETFLKRFQEMPTEERTRLKKEIRKSITRARMKKNGLELCDLLLKGARVAQKQIERKILIYKGARRFFRNLR